MKAASRTRDRGLPSGNEARHYNEDSNRATDALADMYGQQNSEKSGPGTASRSNRRGDGRRAPNVDHHLINTPNSTPSSTSGRSSNTSRGTARGGSSNRGQEPLHTTVSRRPASGPSSPLETANQHFPLNDIEYESNPAAVQQELSNLQALRRMSMDASTASDPDLPGFNLSSLAAPTGGTDEDDPRRLFWVPARLHPELAPEGWKAFVEAKVREVRSPGGQSNSLLSVGIGQAPALRRKKSMLSKQIDNTGGKAAEGYEDGAERLERRRSQNGVPMLKVSDLENLVHDPSSLLRKLSVSPAARVNVNGKIDEDLPILPPLGHHLRRSTRTTYRKERGGGVGGLGSMRRRFPRAGGETDTDDYSPGNSPGSPKIDHTLKRVQTDPLPSVNRIHSRPQGFSTADAREVNESQDSNVRIKPTITSLQTTASSPVASSAPAAPSPSASFEDMLANSASIPPIPSAPPVKSPTSKPNRRSTSPTSRPSHARKESQDKVASVPRIVETPPTDQAQQVNHSERSQNSPQTSPSKSPKRPLVRQGGSENLAGEAGARPSSAGKESLAASSEGKEKRAGRSDSVSSSTRKSSWGWFGGDKEREKEKESKEKASEKDGGNVKVKKSKVSKAEKGTDKDHARLDVIQKSIDGKELQPEKGDGGRDKEKAEASRKSNTQETAGSKKEKESGLFSSFFGGSRKKSGSESQKAKSTRNVSPEQPHVQQNFYYARFPIHIERAIYRLSHLKLANPRRPLLQQVLLSNFMYSYLAKVQMHQPTLLQQQQQQQQLQEQQQREYEQQQLYQQQQAQYEQQHSQYDPQAEQYYQYDDGPNGQVDYAEDSQNYEYEDDDQLQHQPHQQYQHPPRSHSQNTQFSADHGHADGTSGGEYEQQQYQQYYSPSQQYHQQQQHAGDGAAGHRDDDMW